MPDHPALVELRELSLSPGQRHAAGVRRATEARRRLDLTTPAQQDRGLTRIPFPGPARRPIRLRRIGQAIEQLRSMRRINGPEDQDLVNAIRSLNHAQFVLTQNEDPGD